VRGSGTNLEQKFQDLEEERIDYTKSSLWNFANIASTVCVSDDASCEKMRLSLEDCDVEKDITAFIKDLGTGQEIPDPPKFINFCRGDAETSSLASEDENYSVAQFARTMNPSYRASSPQPSMFESHHDPNNPLAKEMGLQHDTQPIHPDELDLALHPTISHDRASAASRQQTAPPTPIEEVTPAPRRAAAPPQEQMDVSTRRSAAPPQDHIDVSTRRSAASPQDYMDVSTRRSAPPPQDHIEAPSRRSAAPPQDHFESSSRRSAAPPQDHIDVSSRRSAAPPQDQIDVASRHRAAHSQDHMNVAQRHSAPPPQQIQPIQNQRTIQPDPRLIQAQQQARQQYQQSQIPHNDYPADGMTQYCRPGAPSDRNNIPSPVRPGSRDSQSDYSNPNSFSSIEPPSGSASPGKPRREAFSIVLLLAGRASMKRSPSLSHPAIATLGDQHQDGTLRKMLVPRGHWDEAIVATRSKTLLVRPVQSRSILAPTSSLTLGTMYSMSLHPTRGSSRSRRNLKMSWIRLHKL
jgi:hypothetical protein